MLYKVLVIATIKLMCIYEHNKMAVKVKIQLKLLDVFKDFNNFVDMNGQYINTGISGTQNSVSLDAKKPGPDANNSLQSIPADA